ncbi:MAG: hypothetical protein KDD78_04405, partial [Caldilineaceae bacterium]|nr:hypothetical protein [Caldilineaceae bacterium]
AGLVQLNDTLIPSPAIDSLTPIDYAVSFVTTATTFYLQEIDIDGSITDLGPFELGRQQGSYTNPDADSMPRRIWLPFVVR